MQSFTRCIAVAAVTLVFGAASAAPAAAKNPVEPLQLGLGDSWAAGFRASTTSEGYVPQLNEALKDDFNCRAASSSSGSDPRWSDKAPAGGCPELELLNLAIPGATTTSMMNVQFPSALPLLESRNGNRDPLDDVKLVTLHTGGNDVFGPIIAACSIGFPNPCLGTVQSELMAYQTDLGNALGLLRDDAGDRTRIVIGTYDNPFRFTPCIQVSGVSGVAALADIILEGAPALGVPLGLHDIMRDVGEDHGVEVAEVYGDLNSAGDWFSSQQPPEARTDCLHPTDSGYDKVTEAFEEVLLGPRRGG
jgi:lysophospholipase L1-like esterase